MTFAFNLKPGNKEGKATNIQCLFPGFRVSAAFKTSKQCITNKQIPRTRHTPSLVELHDVGHVLAAFNRLLYQFNQVTEYFLNVFYCIDLILSISCLKLLCLILVKRYIHWTLENFMKFANN